jgi:hypothetical protein
LLGRDLMNASIDAIDDRIRRRRPRCHSHRCGSKEPFGPKIQFRLNMMDPRTVSATRTDQLASIVAVRATNDDDDVRLLGEIDGGRLAFFRRLTHRIDDADGRFGKSRTNQRDQPLHPFNRLRRLRSDADTRIPGKCLHIIFVQNDMEGFENGLEAWATWQPMRGWRLSGGMSTLRQHLRVKPGVNDPTGPIALGNDPDHQWMLRSAFTLGAGHELDFSVRRVGSVPVQAPARAVPGYTAVDARWGWSVSNRLELSLGVQNVFDAKHVEFDPSRAVFERSAFARARWAF